MTLEFHFGFTVWTIEVFLVVGKSHHRNECKSYTKTRTKSTTTSSWSKQSMPRKMLYASVYCVSKWGFFLGPFLEKCEHICTEARMHAHSITKYTHTRTRAHSNVRRFQRYWTSADHVFSLKCFSFSNSIRFSFRQNIILKIAAQNACVVCTRACARDRPKFKNLFAYSKNDDILRADFYIHSAARQSSHFSSSLVSLAQRRPHLLDVSLDSLALSSFNGVRVFCRPFTQKRSLLTRACTHTRRIPDLPLTAITPCYLVSILFGSVIVVRVFLTLARTCRALALCCSRVFVCLQRAV